MAPNSRSQHHQTTAARSVFIPLRLSAKERALLTVIEGALDVSEYTDNVDVSSNNYFARTAYNKDECIIQELQELVQLTMGLLVSHDHKSSGRRTIVGKELTDNEKMIRKCIEVGRRHKICNPDKMRSTYGKLLYAVMDSVNPRIRKQLRMNLKGEIKTVHAMLSGRVKGLELLSDERLMEASQEVTGTTPEEIAESAEKKQSALKFLIDTYTGKSSSSGLSDGDDDDDDDDDDDVEDDEVNDGNSRVTTSAHGYGMHDTTYASTDMAVESDTQIGGSSSSKPLKALRPRHVKLVVASLADNESFIRTNRGPVDSMIMYLKRFFAPHSHKQDESLDIRAHREGSMLTHSHETQYNFVLQSLMLWKEITGDFFRLWFLSENDLLHDKNGYRLCNTGQGLQRCQSAPQVASAMREILSRVRSQVSGWVGLQVVHLGDRDVPNALTFIDKYTQVPRILGPIVSTLDRIGDVIRSDAGVRAYIASEFGSKENKADGGADVESLTNRVQKMILRDFFRHGFDGSGDDGGSCIDGRLTSSWNWCSKLEKKDFFPIFLLCGHQGFEGSFEM